MDLRLLAWLSFTLTAALVSCLPVSLLEEIKTRELRDNKVKRARPDLVHDSEERSRDVPYYSKPTAIKRGTNIKTNPSEQTWDQSLQTSENLPADLQARLFKSEDNPFEDKAIVGFSGYGKDFRFDPDHRLDEAIENAVLNSQIYGEAAPPYRYYGVDNRRRRRDTKRLRLDNRLKRDIDVTPEEFVQILALYGNEHQNNLRPPWQHPERNFKDISEENTEEDENWLDTPVYPHAGKNDINNNYYYEERPQMLEKRGRWGGYADRRKRFMVSKRNYHLGDLRAFNGLNKNDYYTLADSLHDQRELTVPLYHRLVL